MRVAHVGLKQIGKIEHDQKRIESSEKLAHVFARAEWPYETRQRLFILIRVKSYEFSDVDFFAIYGQL